MRIFLLAVSVALAFAPGLRADQQTLEVQQALKDQGFYYGNTDGQMGTETTAAIRRYQIRNGLEVSGQLGEETLKSLKITGENTPPAVTSVPSRAPVTDEPRDGSDLRAPASPDRRVVESDRSFLDRQAPPAQPPRSSERAEEGEEEASPPPTSVGRGAGYGALFARTPYARAPAQVQQTALLRIQSFLSREGFYRGAIDGIPGPELESAILDYQIDADLPRSGRLDLATLDDMKMLPGRSGPFPIQRERRETTTSSRRVYRGIWVH